MRNTIHSSPESNVETGSVVLRDRFGLKASDAASRKVNFGSFREILFELCSNYNYYRGSVNRLHPTMVYYLKYQELESERSKQNKE